MRATITGASGLLGGNLAALLAREGHQVRATRRGTSRVEHLAAVPIEWVTAELGDVAALTEAFRGADVVFHCAAQVSILRKPTPGLVKTNVEGTRNVLEAVKKAGSGRLVHCSTVAAVGLSVDGKPSDERARWNFDERGMADGYSTTKHQAEELVTQAAREGLNVVIANPTFMFGPMDSKPSSGELIVSVVRGKVPGRTPGMNNFVDVRDVARGLLLAAEKGRSGERYILSGENLSYGEIAAKIAAAAGVRAPTWNVPRALALPLGWLGDLQGALFGTEPQVNSVTVSYGYCRDFIFTSEKARAELGYQSSPIDGAIRDAVAWFRGAGMLPA